MRIIIRAVLPDRKIYVDYLKSVLPTAEFVYDLHRSGRETMQRALMLAGEDAVIHMEDDAVVCNDFISKVTEVIAQKPNQVIQFFSRRGEDLTKGSRKSSSFSYNLCYYLPKGYSKLLITYAPQWASKHPEHKCANDLVINDFLRERNEKHYIHCPSLVDHRIGVSSLDPRRPKKRISKTFTL